MAQVDVHWHSSPFRIITSPSGHLAGVVHEVHEEWTPEAGGSYLFGWTPEEARARGEALLAAADQAERDRGAS